MRAITSFSVSFGRRLWAPPGPKEPLSHSLGTKHQTSLCVCVCASISIKKKAILWNWQNLWQLRTQLRFKQAPTHLLLFESMPAKAPKMTFVLGPEAWCCMALSQGFALGATQADRSSVASSHAFSISSCNGTLTIGKCSGLVDPGCLDSSSPSSDKETHIRTLSWPRPTPKQRNLRVCQSVRDCEKAPQPKEPRRASQQIQGCPRFRCPRPLALSI